ncbi:MAG: RadC family protein [Planctomycetota bacterium]
MQERDGVPYGDIYGRLHAELSRSGMNNVQEEDPPRWDRPELVRMFRRLGTVPSSHTDKEATLRVLLVATEMAQENDVSRESVYADLMRFTDDDDPQGRCVEQPMCAKCVIRENCDHASRSPRMKDLPPSERPRERLLTGGEQHLTDTELLAVLIGGGYAGSTAVDLAREALSTFGSLPGVATAGNEELKTIRGIGPVKIARIRSGFELGRRLSAGRIDDGMAIKGSQQVFTHFRERLRDKKQEVFLCLLLNTRHKVIREHQVSVGSLNESVVHPREVFKKALKESAHAVLFVHNHPSGDPAPSPQDRQLTKRLHEVGKLMGIEVIDHMIVGKDRYYSFAEQGQLRNSQA